MKVDIIIPSYDGKYLYETLESCHKQSYKDFSICVIDNASKYDIKKICDKFKEVKYIRAEKNLGPAGGRNLGIKNTTGDIISFIDDDDIMHQDKLLLSVEQFIKNKKAGMILLGQNWRVQESLEVQYHVLNFFGFETPEELFMGWQFTRDTDDEEQRSYQESSSSFEQSWGMEIPNKEETIKKEGGLVKESAESKFTSVKVSDFNSFISKLSWK